MTPKYLYHYTKIETLIKIIESQKIRFTRLDLLNDPYEGIVVFEDIKEYSNIQQKCIYCSCWTPEETESVGLWKIYTDMRGVRIKIRSDLFVNDYEGFKCREIKEGFVPVSEIKPIALLDKGKINEIVGPIKISYVNDLKATYQNAIGTSIANAGKEDEFMMYDISFDELGIRKLDYWKFENECRYLICPFIKLRAGKNAFENVPDFPTPEYIDIPFYKDIEEILVGPEVSNEQIDEITKFLETEKNNISVSKSPIKIVSK